MAAGPVGRTVTAQTDAQMHADILSWSRSQGLFAAVAIEGATLRQDLDDNKTLYGKPLETREIVTSGVPAPAAAAKLLALLYVAHFVRAIGAAAVQPLACTLPTSNSFTKRTKTHEGLSVEWPGCAS